jgi:hypothetical protein
VGFGRAVRGLTRSAGKGPTLQTIAQVLAWSAQPLGSLVGAWAILATGRISAVYASGALLVLAVSVSFWRPVSRALNEVDTNTTQLTATPKP